jgi:phosphoribosylformylglycinamidine (FGAM) synthase PurS component
MPEFEFAIELTVPDNTAFTVLTALQRLGYQELERVERTELLRLRLRDGSMSAAECAAVLTNAEIVFNPNKHRLSRADAAGSGAFEAVVADKDDDPAALCELLSSRFGVRGLEGLERATAWRLYERETASSAQRHDWACRTLLANPFSQTYAVRERPSYVGVVPITIFIEK